MQDEIGDALRRGEVDQRAEVLPAGVHAAVRDESHQVEAPGLAAGRARRAQHLVLGERAVRDRVVDPRQVLPDDRAGAEVEVADLGVPHLAVREPDRPAAGVELGVAIGAPQLVEHGSVGELDGVSGARRREPPAVEDHQADRGHRRRTGTRREHHGTAAATIPANSTGSRLAPPTSAPSTSGWARISAAFSAFTLPP